MRPHTPTRRVARPERAAVTDPAGPDGAPTRWPRWHWSSGRGLATTVLRTATGLLAAVLLIAAATAVLPGPHLHLLVVSVVAVEQALLLVAGALVVLVLCATTARARGAGSRRWRAAPEAIAAVAAVVVAAVALTTTADQVAAARREGADVAWSRYLAGTGATAASGPSSTEVYATVDGQELLADVWRPPAGSPPAPAAGRRAVVRVHGGSWSAGVRSGTPEWDAELAAAGAVVVDVDYRLAGSGTGTSRGTGSGVGGGAGWREQPRDVACALAWVGANASRLGVDPARVAVMGESAGAHLALVAAYALESYPPSCGLAALRPDAVVALYPPTELVSLERSGGWRHPDVLEGEGVLDLMGASPERAPADYAEASPLTHATAGVPPTLLIHGDHDQVVPVDQSRRLAEALAAAGVEHRLVELPFSNHGFDVAWGGVGAQTARTAVAGWLRDH